MLILETNTVNVSTEFSKTIGCWHGHKNAPADMLAVRTVYHWCPNETTSQINGFLIVLVCVRQSNLFTHNPSWIFLTLGHSLYLHETNIWYMKKSDSVTRWLSIKKSVQSSDMRPLSCSTIVRTFELFLVTVQSNGTFVRVKQPHLKFDSTPWQVRFCNWISSVCW